MIFGYNDSALAFVRVFLTFLIGGTLAAYAIDWILLSIAMLLEHRAARDTISLLLHWPALALLAPIVHLKVQFLSAIAASLCLLAMGRVVLWWVIVVGAVVSYRVGFNPIADSLWLDIVGAQQPRWASLKPATAAMIQLLVAIGCWWWVRNETIPARHRPPVPMQNT